MDHETDRHPPRRGRKPGEPDQGGGTGAVAGAACTPVPQTGMTQFYATSLISAWHFLHERLWVRPKASFDELFLAAGEALRVLRFSGGLRGEAEGSAGDIGENHVVFSPDRAKQSSWLFFFASDSVR